MSIRLIKTDAHADLGDAWLRCQLARLSQKRAQYGGHYRMDTGELLARLACMRKAANASAANRIGRATIEAVEYCSRLETRVAHASTSAAVQ